MKKMLSVVMSDASVWLMTNQSDDKKRYPDRPG